MFARTNASWANVAARLVLWGWLVLLIAESPVGNQRAYLTWFGIYVLFLLFYTLVQMRVRVIFWLVFVGIFFLMPVTIQPHLQTVAQMMWLFLHHQLLHGELFRRPFARDLVVWGFVTFGTKLIEECLSRPVWLWIFTLLSEGVLFLLNPAGALQSIGVYAAFILLGFFLLVMSEELALQSHPVRQEPPLLTRMMRMVGPLAVLTLSVLFLPSFFTSWVHVHRVQANTQLPSTQNGLMIDGLNSRHLGGPFTGTSQVLLRVFAKHSSYDLGEVFNQFTGQGWINRKTSFHSQFGNHFAAGVPTRELQQKVDVVAGQYPVVFGAYQMVAVKALQVGMRDRYSRTADAFSLGTIGPGTAYTVTSLQPDPSEQMLAQVHDGNLAYAFPNDLQLPSKLPTRDVILAQRITAQASGTEGKVLALIRYLRSHEKYATTDIPKLSPGQDFVDQFLFVTHRGYCDQFASALTILARAVGIPARYAVGFVAVPPERRIGNSLYEYVLRGADAHAWTQIWFAGYGWISFDATPPSTRPFIQPTVVHPLSPAALSKTSNIKVAGTTPIGFLQSKVNPWFRLLVFAVVSIVLFGLTPFLVVRRIKDKKIQLDHATELLRDEETRVMNTEILTNLYQKYGLRFHSETLREYARRVQDDNTRSELTQVIWEYERIFYGHEPTHPHDDE